MKRATLRYGRAFMTAALACGLIAVAASGAPARAATPHVTHPCVTCLGPIVNLVRGNDTLSAFRRISVNLTRFGRPELLYLQTIGRSGGGTVESWAIVKALDQFGSWSHVKIKDKVCGKGAVPVPIITCSAPLYDLSRAVYRSHYASFVFGRLAFRSTKFVLAGHFSSAEHRLFDKICPPQAKLCNPAMTEGWAEAIGRYLALTSYKLFYADFSGQDPSPPLTLGPDPNAYKYQYDFATVQNAMLRSKDPNGGATPVEDINSEANVMIALICAQDGGKPASVCRQSPIKRIVKYVK